jgi:para-nitrobenzyl esterase
MRMKFVPAALAALGAAMIGLWSPGAAAASEFVTIAQGTAIGLAVPGMNEFLGIPFAAPPVGPLRWMPPEPAAPFPDGVLEATQFHAHCAQTPSPFGVDTLNEDCLYLNVYTPTGPTIDLPGLHPVLVWFHGGSLSFGESDDYGAAKLVEAGGIILVTVNYRLGALGFLANSAFDAESPQGVSGNYGILDQQAALRWVRANIAAFGGDPFNVTIAGQSAGGAAVVANLIGTNTAAGLFERAIIESGASLSANTIAGAEARDASFVAAVGCGSEPSLAATASCLRDLPVSTILTFQGGSAISPIVDGFVLPQQPFTAFSSGQFNRVPILNGTNHDEFSLFVALDADLSKAGPLTAPAYPFDIAATLGLSPMSSEIPEVEAEYPLADFPSPDLALTAVGTDGTFACSAFILDQLTSKFVLVSAYEFADENAPELFLPAVSFPYGAAHASELQYLFVLPQSAAHSTVFGPSLPAQPLDLAQEGLSRAMVSYWTSFARFGTPLLAIEPPWLPFFSTSTDFISLVTPAPRAITNFSSEHNCAFWTPLIEAPFQAP